MLLFGGTNKKKEKSPRPSILKRSDSDQGIFRFFHKCFSSISEKGWSSLFIFWFVELRRIHGLGMLKVYMEDGSYRFWILFFFFKQSFFQTL